MKLVLKLERKNLSTHSLKNAQRTVVGTQTTKRNFEALASVLKFYKK